MKVTLTVPKPSNKTWTVKGKDLSAVFDNLNKNKFWGRYRSNHATSFSGKGDKIDSVKVSASPVVLMPSWAGYGKATKDEKKSWDTMWKALKKHEDNHHVIFSDAADEWKKDIEKGGELSKKDFDQAWKDFNTETQKKQDKYDDRTDHGAKEGVILNIP